MKKIPLRLLWTVPLLAFSAHGTTNIRYWVEAANFRSFDPTLIADTLWTRIRNPDSSDFFFYPFGEFTRLAPLRKAVTRGVPGWRFAPGKNDPEKLLAIHGTDSLEFRLWERFGIRRFEIGSVDIKSNHPRLLEGIRIGMDKRDFFGIFYRECPLAEYRKFRVFATCTGYCEGYRWDSDGPAAGKIHHYYTFRARKLIRIEIRGN